MMFSPGHNKDALIEVFVVDDTEKRNASTAELECVTEGAPSASLPSRKNKGCRMEVTLQKAVAF